jgi:hypothetical protein
MIESTNLGNLEAGDHYDDPDLGRRILLYWILEKYSGGANWILVAEETD